MNALSVSVVVVSRQRPAYLRRCLTALSQLYYPSVEIIVVADAGSLKAVNQQEISRQVVFDEPNIAKARNIGIETSAGDIIAFIDDDAVPEPTWLDYLIEPFGNPEVAASGGFVMGRNGFSLQWGALSLDREGWDHPIDMDADETAIYSTQPGGRAIRTQGTNMAFRRSTFAELGGFDPAFQFFHEESDLNMRVALAGQMTAVVPMARVYHASAPSERRRQDRAPLTLFQVGASSAVFHRKYLEPREWARAREELRIAQHRRLVAMMVDGRIEPKQVEDLTKDLLAGYDEGLARELVGPCKIGPPCNSFDQPIAQRNRDHKCIFGPANQAKSLKQRAQTSASDGNVTTAMIFSRSTKFHQLEFNEAGFWEQTGGLYGRAERHEPLFRKANLALRAEAEMQRNARFRNPVNKM